MTKESPMSDETQNQEQQGQQGLDGDATELGGIDQADVQQSSPAQADSEVADPDGNPAREAGDDDPADDATGVAPFGVGRFGVGGVTLDR